MRRSQAIGTRWLGVGLAAVLAVVTLSLALTGRLGLYINPDSTWFALSMAVVVLVGTVFSFLLPLGAEEDHGHGGDHHDEDEASEHALVHAAPRSSGAAFATVVGGVAASGVVVSTLR